MLRNNARTDQSRGFADDDASSSSTAQTHFNAAGSAALAQIAPEIAQALDEHRSIILTQVKDAETSLAKVWKELDSSTSQVIDTIHLNLQAMKQQMTGMTNALQEQSRAEEDFYDFSLQGSTKMLAILTTAIAASEAGDSQARAGILGQITPTMDGILAEQAKCHALRQRLLPTLAGTTLPSASLDATPAPSSSSTATTAPPLAPGTCPPYEMSKSVKSVVELAEEWWVPHGAYNTCVAQLEEEWGPRWREDQPDPTTGKRRNTRSKFYGDRLVIIDEVNRRAKARASRQDREVTLVDRQAAAKELDDERQGRSLYHLQEKLKGQRPPKKRRTVSDSQPTSAAT